MRHAPPTQDHAGTPPVPCHRTALGFTLIELVIALAVMAILATWAVPGLQAQAARQEVTSDVMRLKTALAMARNAAITRRTPIVVCPLDGSTSAGCSNGNDWTRPLLIKPWNDAGAPALRILADGEVDSITYREDRPVRFTALGRASGYNGTFRICGRRGNAARVIVSNFGRVRVESGADC
ncbi:MAG: GspH/FimT family pseudopilin [Pseudomonadota bacterium]